MTTLIAAVRRYHRFASLRKAIAGAKNSVEPELLLLHTLLEPQKAFLDVGANIGEYVYAAKKYIPLSHIYAFEPQQAYVSDLQAFFPGLSVQRVALSNISGEARLKIPVINQTLYRTRGTLESFQEKGEDDAQFEAVPTATLDAMVAQLGIGAIGCIKIDVEGHEGAVLEGAQQTLRLQRPALIVEIEQRHHKEPITHLFAWLLQRGYKGQFIDPSSGALVPVEQFSISQHQQEEAFKTPAYIRNFIFTPYA